MAQVRLARLRIHARVRAWRALVRAVHAAPGRRLAALLNGHCVLLRELTCASAARSKLLKRSLRLSAAPARYLRSCGRAVARVLVQRHDRQEPASAPPRRSAGCDPASRREHRLELLRHAAHVRFRRNQRHAGARLNRASIVSMQRWHRRVAVPLNVELRDRESRLTRETHTPVHDPPRPLTASAAEAARRRNGEVDVGLAVCQPIDIERLRTRAATWGAYNRYAIPSSQKPFDL